MSWILRGFCSLQNLKKYKIFEKSVQNNSSQNRHKPLQFSLEQSQNREIPDI